MAGSSNISLRLGLAQKQKQQHEAIKESMRPINGPLHTPSFSVKDFFSTSHGRHHLSIQQEKVGTRAKKWHEMTMHNGPDRDR